MLWFLVTSPLVIRLGRWLQLFFSKQLLVFPYWRRDELPGDEVELLLLLSFNKC